METPEVERAPNTRPHTMSSKLSVTEGSSRHYHPESVTVVGLANRNGRF